VSRNVYLVTDTDECNIGTVEEIFDNEDDAKGTLFAALQDIVDDLEFGDEDTNSATVTIEIR
jgi:hypothetical protein